ncbi:hypothetical protein [Oceanidesulfovibrio marinus]|uniref:Uncharacterized protein n=1 Tax=Oceanidesulfovibrio marinus TaxID=370038 RepID=A0ABX6NBZ2_9BACT|nr:hypothetical protein [Oceanidesulfovibrio marinus]QJT07598.1 hypothetical protein E8L03_01085 [Oceanidesulfovibrio marinus]
MNLLPQDVLVMLKLAVSPPPEWSYDRLAYQLGMSPSMAHSAVKRATRAALFDPMHKRPRNEALIEFLIHGVKYAFPPDIGATVTGVPTAFVSPEMQDSAPTDLAGEYYVWPYPNGEHRGVSLSPLYRSVPEIARYDAAMHTALGLLDSIRIGREPEQKLAEQLLGEMLG